jgi:hypothetical protein
MTPLYATYADWLAGLKNWLGTDEQPDPDTALFLYLAQQRLNRELQSVYMEAEANITVTAPMAGLPIPLSTSIPDFNKIRLVTPNTYGFPLYSSSISEITAVQAAYAMGNSFIPSSVAPGFYCIDRMELITFPNPSEGQIINVKYYAEVPFISTTVDTNIFTDRHSDILLFASLLEGSAFIVEDERVPLWNEKYVNGVESSNNTGKHQKLGSTPLVRQIRGLP